MQNRAAPWMLLSSSCLLVLAASPLSAGFDSWVFGTTFSVGGMYFRIGYAESGPFGSSFYFEATQPFHYRGYACSTSCYRHRGRYYHHPRCAVVHHHFVLHGHSPGYFFEHYGPPIAYPPPPYSWGAPHGCCGPPAYYYGPPGWSIRYYGHHDRHYKPKYPHHYRSPEYHNRHEYRDRHRYDPYKQDRHRQDWHRRDYRDNYRNYPQQYHRDRSNRGGLQRAVPEQQRSHPSDSDRVHSGQDRRNRGGMQKARPEREQQHEQR